MIMILKLYTCIAAEHDLRLVFLAVLLCGLASVTAVTLLHHLRKSSGYLRNAWLGVAAITTGFGIWATHFVAMLAFSPTVHHGYNISVTVLSLLAACNLTGIGLAVAASNSQPVKSWLGGALVGAGIATMHYTGMAAFETEARLLWNPRYVAVSLFLAAFLGALALRTTLMGDTKRWQLVGALLLTMAICGHHFTAMAAISMLPDPLIQLSSSVMAPRSLAVAVAVAGVIIILLTCAGMFLDLRARQRTRRQFARLQALANATVGGLVVCDGDSISTANESFLRLVDCPMEAVVGARLDQFIPGLAARLAQFQASQQPVETDLRDSAGVMIPIELQQRPLDFRDRSHFAIAVRDLRARKQAEQRIQFLAHHDALTDLPNRPSFNRTIDREIETVLKSGGQLALLCLDLDFFKEVNDAFGHATGDKVLQIVAKSVSGILDDSQIMARLGGDEFAIILPAIPNPGIAGRVADNILAVLRAEHTNANPTTHISTSIGIAICPRDATDRHGLLSHADTALYCSKREGRGTYRFFAPSMGADLRDRRFLEHDLRHAISRQELRVVYQPQKDLQTDTIVGFEALLRWKHPTRGEISPNVFIPIAEESGSIIEIGDWVLRAACEEAAGWRGDFTIAVNVSTVQLHNDKFTDRLQAVLLETKMPAHRLEIEITETSLVRDLTRALAALRQIKMLGARIVMDDFGTGYSSLSNLRAFPFDKIKIDRSFIKSVDSNLQSAIIVRAMLGLGRGLGLPVLAEGVETEAELKFLADEHCDEYQGYLLARPDSIDTFAYLVHGSTRFKDAAVALGGEPEKRLRVVRP
jgi:diguanylate cyclase